MDKKRVKQTVRKLKHAMNRRQLQAMRFPILERKKPVDGRYTETHVEKGVTWQKQLTFDFNGGPEMIGPVWHVEVWILEEGRRINIARWTPEQQQLGKDFLLVGLKNVGLGDRVDVRVDDDTLHVFRQATVVEAALATHAAGSSK